MKDSLTASELMTQLLSDRDFLAKKAERERDQADREAAFRSSAQPVLRDLACVGITLSDLEELPRKYAPLVPQVVEVLLRWIPGVEDERVQEHLVRALAASGEPFDGRPLVDLFEKSQSEVLRWAIANTLAEARPLGISDWLVSAVTGSSYGQPREMLLLAMARLVPVEPAKEMLRSLFDEFPGHAAMAFGEIGTPDDIGLLELKRRATKGWVRKEIDKAIRRIRSRGGE